jgi:nicotinate-nucleotide pyrophosphorylase (carboxylating)
MNLIADTILHQAILEDVTDYNGNLMSGDHTSEACIEDGQTGRARLICKADGVIAGIELAELIFKDMSETFTMQKLIEDGATIKKGDIAFIVEGEVKFILRAERIVLNFMQRMSGIATNTAAFVQQVKGTKAKIIDTRKTTPALRYFEKWAVRIGGGQNNRYGLFDMFMLKDNHIDFCGGISKAIALVKKYQHLHKMNLPVEIEARSLADVEEILLAGNVTRIMLDNMTLELMREALQMINKRFETEASGGITLQTVRAYAETGVDFISVGALTHSYNSLDLSLKAF